MFTSRQERLINNLIKASKPLNLEFLSRLLDVSKRTLRKDIADINLLLEGKDFSIHNARGKGYYIDREEKSDFRQYMISQEEQYNPIPINARQRKIYLYFKIIMAQGPFSTEKVAEEVFVSKTSIYHDISEIADELKSFANIELEISKAIGFILHAEEKEKRQILSQIVYRNNPEDFKYLLKMFRSYDIGNDHDYLNMKTIIENYRDQVSNKISDIDVVNLVIEILIMMQRISNGNTIRDDMCKPKNNSMNFPFADIEALTHVKLSDAEYNYLLERVETHYFPSTLKMNADMGRVRNVVEVFLEQCLKDPGERIQFTSTDTKKLELHLYRILQNPSLTLHKEEMQAYNIQEKYPDLFELSHLFGPLMEEAFDIKLNEADYAYITVYLVILSYVEKSVDIVIVSNNSTALVELLKKKIVKVFGKRLNILGTYSLNQFQSREKNKNELVLATDTILDDYSENIIYIDIFLDNTSILTIKNALKKFDS